jgi:uncharacterized membrane protein YecN with MAPEG domain
MAPDHPGEPRRAAREATARDFRSEQRGVAGAMLGAGITTIVVLGIAVATRTGGASTPFADRLQGAIGIDLVVVAWLVAAIANVASLRFFSECDIAASSGQGGSPDIRVAGAILQNTLEQVALAVFAHIAVAATFDPSQSLIMALASLFAVGRLLFWQGYRPGARARAFGFALTFYPSVVALIGAAGAMLI